MKKKSRLSQILILLLFVLIASNILAKTASDPEKMHTVGTRSCLHVRSGGSVTTVLETTEFANAQVQIENIDKSFRMSEQIVLNPGNNVLKFHVAEIPSGAYFVRISSNGATQSFTMVVQ
jgi:hypothetical protein